MNRFQRMRSWLILGGVACLFLAAGPAGAAGLMPDVFEKAKQARPEMTKTLEQLVNIDSGTGHGAGIKQIADIATARLKALGATVETFPAATPEAAGQPGGHPDRHGQGPHPALGPHGHGVPPGHGGPAPLPPGRRQGRGPRRRQTKKNGVTIGLAALKLIKDLNFKNFAKITLVLNCDEEVGSGSSRELITRLAKEHDYALCLEGGRQGDGIVVARKGTARLIVEVKGKASHAGGSPKLGRNALMELAHQIVQLHALNNDELGTSVHFTVLTTPTG